MSKQAKHSQAQPSTAKHSQAQPSTAKPKHQLTMVVAEAGLAAVAADAWLRQIPTADQGLALGAWGVRGVLKGLLEGLQLMHVVAPAQAMKVLLAKAILAMARATVRVFKGIFVGKPHVDAALKAATPLP